MFFLGIKALLQNSWNDFKENYLRFIIFNVIWFLFASILVFISLQAFFNKNYFLLAIPLIFGGPLLQSGFQVAENKNFKFKSIFIGIKNRIYKTVIIFIFMTAVYIVLAYDFVFVLNKIGDNKLLLIIPVLIIYLIWLFNMYQLTLWGLLTLKPKEKLSALLKKSYKLTVNNFVFALFWSILTIVVVIALIYSRFGAVIIMNSFLSILTINGSKYMLENNLNKGE